MADRNVDEEFTCHVCYSVFLQPITNTCGHTTCKGCLRICRRRCPDCRKAIVPGIGVNIALQAFIERTFPEALAARLREAKEAAAHEAEHRPNHRELLLETGEFLPELAIPEGILVANMEQLLFEELMEMEIRWINGIQIVESSQLRVLSDGRELQAGATLPGPEHQLILRITLDNQSRIQTMAEQFAEDALPEEVLILQRVADNLENRASNPLQSRSLSRLLDAVETYVQTMPPVTSSRGSYNLSVLERLAHLIETHTEDLENLPQLIKDLAARQGF